MSLSDSSRMDVNIGAKVLLLQVSLQRQGSIVLLNALLETSGKHNQLFNKPVRDYFLALIHILYPVSDTFHVQCTCILGLYGLRWPHV